MKMKKLKKNLAIVVTALMIGAVPLTVLAGSEEAMVIQDFNQLSDVKEGCWTDNVTGRGGSAQLIDDGNGGKALELTIPSQYQDIGPAIPFAIHGDMSQAKYIEFYVKGPGTNEPKENGSHNFAVNFQININEKGADGNVIKDEWWRMCNQNDVAFIKDGVVGEYYIKAKGDNDWTKCDASVGAGDVVWISKNFEGWIRVPLDNYYFKFPDGYEDNKNFDKGHINAATIWLVAASNTTNGKIVFDDFKAVGNFPAADNSAEVQDNNTVSPDNAAPAKDENTAQNPKTGDAGIALSLFAMVISGAAVLKTSRK